MINLENSTFLYIPLNFKMPEDVRQRSVEFFDGLDEKLWDYNKFRNSYFLTLYTRSISEVTANAGADGLQWLMNKTPSCLRDWIEAELMPCFEPFGRVAIVKSLPGDAMNVHVDSGRKEFDAVKIEPKFRYVMDGTLDDLYFETDKGMLRCEPCSHSYIMDGAWPHYAVNKGKRHRYVLALGRPWLGQVNERLGRMLEETFSTRKEQVLDRHGYNRIIDKYESYTNV